MPKLMGAVASEPVSWSGLPRDQVDQPVGDENRALDPPCADGPLHVGARQRARLRIRLVGPRGHLDPVAKPSVDLDDDRDLEPPELRRIDLGPALEDEQPVSALPLPE